MKKFLAASVALALSVVTASASGPLHLGKFQDNWFVSGGIGVNTILDNGYFGVPKVAADINIGKWFTPQVGLRLGYQGFANQATDTSAGWFAGKDTFGFHYAHVDVMWNPFKCTSRFNGGPYLHAGPINTVWNKLINTEVGIGIGLWAQFRVVENLSVVADLRPVFAREDAWRQSGKVICFASATLGVSYAFAFGKNGKVGFEKHTREVEYVKVAVPVSCNHEAEIQALQAKVEALTDSLALAKATPAEPQKIGQISIYFDLNKSEVKEKELYHLIDLVNILPEGATLNLTGHADKETGTKKRNRVLSEERVNVVSEALLRLGFKGKINSGAQGDEANPYTGYIPKNRVVIISVIL